jgi:PIN domain nuclease of toxin-antitoxin system
MLLDSHTLLWWLAGDEALSSAARAAIGGAGNDVFVSAASAWEIATKHRIGKLPGAATIVGDLGRTIAEQGFLELPIGLRHGQVAGSLASAHRDPFDRMLIAQVLLENLVLVSNELAFDAFGVVRLW